jgi:hypothetical protein
MMSGLSPKDSSHYKQQELDLNKDVTLQPKAGEGKKQRK